MRVHLTNVLTHTHTHTHAHTSQVRRYEAFDVAETPTGSSELVGSGEGFNALAGYIFGDAKQAMTTPGARRAGA